MSGDTKESEDESKRFKISTTEKYETPITGGHYLILETWVKDEQTGEKILAKTHKHKLPKSVPKYITKLDLWHHTRGELLDLKTLTKSNNERKPSTSTLSQWKESIQLSKLNKMKNVLQQNNTNKPKTNNN